MLEVKITECGPTEWEWRVCQVGGQFIEAGWQKTRADAKRQAEEGRYSVCLPPTGAPNPSDTGLAGDTEEVDELRPLSLDSGFTSRHSH